MKIILIPLFVCIASIGSCQKDQRLATTNTSQKPIVVELFTSEGCSSCPSADKLLAEISDKNPNILLLSFHVDYWNRLGWVDSFSNALYTKRQYNYAAQMQLSSVYTPQAVFNGHRETVGSNRNNINSLLAAKYQAASILNGAKATFSNKVISVNINAKQIPKNYELLALLVQPNAATKVKAGENSGSFLQHKNVVRDMVSITLNSNTAILTAPFSSNDWKVAILVQDKNSLQIADAIFANVTY